MTSRLLLRKKKLNIYSERRSEDTGDFPLPGWRWHRHHLRFLVWVLLRDADGCSSLAGHLGAVTPPSCPRPGSFLAQPVLLAGMLG